jgi:hypothetical protein
MRLIPLTKGYFAKVDATDYEYLAQYQWHAVRKRSGAEQCAVYAAGYIDGQRIYMHRLLCAGRAVDHINGDSLDNRRANLRPSNAGLNNMNRRSVRKDSGKPIAMRRLF